MASDAFEALAAAVSNWGRWGDDDERGTLNLLTSAAVRRGAAAVQTGQAFSLALPYDESVPRTLGNQRRVSPIHSMLSIDVSYTGHPDDSCWSEDMVTTGLQSGTHWDALAHVSWRHLLYNGFPVSTIDPDHGATRCGIDKCGPIVGRGVLLDVARARGADWLENGDAITPDDLSGAVRRAGVTVEPGDVVLLRTGAMRHWHEGRRKVYVSGSPGFALECARWFRDHDVAAVAADTQNPDVFPPADMTMLMPFGVLCLQQMGLLLGQNFDLEALATTCEEERRWAFLLSATPERVTGGLGSPVNPIATL